MIEELLRHYYSSGDFKDSHSIFKKRCKEKNCILKGNLDDYIVLDGDNIEKYVSASKRKSSDCIIVDRFPKENNEVDVILCELCRGRKDFKEVREKIINSAEHIVDVFDELEISINMLKCCYLGKYGDYKLALKLISKPIHVHGFDEYDVLIENFACGTDIETIKNS